MESGSLFKDSNSLRRGFHISIAIAVSLSHQDRMAGHSLPEEAKDNQKESYIREDRERERRQECE